MCVCVRCVYNVVMGKRAHTYAGVRVMCAYAAVSNGAGVVEIGDDGVCWCVCVLCRL